MVAHEPGDWFTESLRGLAQQTYESLQALILVTGEESDPLSRAILDTIATEMPAAVVRFLGGNPGFAASCNSVLNLVQGDSGFFCFMHDDVALAPDAISLLVEELYRSNAGAVGPKLTYWDNPKMIQSVGVDVDRFGVELPIADDGELDQEQHDAVRDVFKLSSACMLVRADLFRTVKGFTESLATSGADLDLCWRLHAAGARVVVVPAAIARHKENSTMSLASDMVTDSNLEAEIVRVQSVVALSSISQVPFTVMQMYLLTIVRVVLLLVTGRTSQALIEVRAMWSLPFGLGDIRRRRDELSEHREVDGSEIRALQLSGSSYVTAYVRRKARRAGISQSQASGVVHEAPPRSSYVMWISLLLLFVIGSRSLFVNGVVSVGQFAPFRGSARELVASYASGWWGAGFGQVSALPTGIALIATGAITTLGNMGLLHTLSVCLLPVIGWLGVWRFASVLGTRAGRISSTVAYAAVPLPYASIASGRWGALLLYATVPWIVHLGRMLVGHADIDDSEVKEVMAEAPPLQWRRWFASLTLVVAVVAAFEPSVLLVLPVIAAVIAVVSITQGVAMKWVLRWVGVTAGIVVAAIAMNIPWSATYLRSGWWEALTGAPVESGRNLGLFGLAQFDVGSFALSSVTILLYGVVLGSIFLVTGPRAVWALRGAALVAVGLLLALLDDALLLPAHLPEPAILLVIVAFGIAVCAGAMGASFVLDLRKARFGWRQPLSALVAIAFLVAMVPAGINTLGGSWNQPSLSLPQLLAQLPSAEADGGYRTLFIGDSRVLPGSPLNFGWGIAYSVVNGPDPSAEESWETPPTRLRDNAVDAMYGIVRGQTSRAGRLLAPLSVRFIVVPIIDGGQSTRSHTIAAPRGLVESLSRQLDLRRRYASSDVVIFENTTWVPVRSQLTAAGAQSSTLAGASSMIATDIAGATALPSALRPESAIQADVVAGTVHLSVPFTSRWEVLLDGVDVPARPAFGLTNAYDISAPGKLEMSFSASILHTCVVLLQFVAWCTVAFIAVSRRRKKKPSEVSAQLGAEGAVIHMNDGVVQ